MQAINEILGSELEIGAELTEAQMELLSGGCGSKGKGKSRGKGKGSSCSSSKSSSKSSSVGCKPVVPPVVVLPPVE